MPTKLSNMYHASHLERHCVTSCVTCLFREMAWETPKMQNFICLYFYLTSLWDCLLNISGTCLLISKDSVELVINWVAWVTPPGQDPHPGSPWRSVPKNPNWTLSDFSPLSLKGFCWSLQWKVGDTSGWQRWLERTRRGKPGDSTSENFNLTNKNQ